MHHSAWHLSRKKIIFLLFFFTFSTLFSVSLIFVPFSSLTCAWPLGWVILEQLHTNPAVLKSGIRKFILVSSLPEIKNTFVGFFTSVIFTCTVQCTVQLSSPPTFTENGIAKFASKYLSFRHHGGGVIVMEVRLLSSNRLRLTPRCLAHCNIKLRCMHDTVESDSVVCMTPWIQTPWCAWHRGVRLRGVHDTAGKPGVGIKTFCRYI